MTLEWFVYLLLNPKGVSYTGIAKDVAARLAKHNRGVGAKFTRGRGPWQLIHQEGPMTRGQALRRELALKRDPIRKTSLKQAASSEEIQTLFSAPHLRIERIISTGQSSPPGFWYDQEWAEWVMLLQGAARLLIAGEAAPRSLGAGDRLLLAAHQRHRVEWTDPDQITIWLAVHFAGPTP